MDEFLQLASAKYSVKSYLGPAPEFDVKKEYGPFACGTYVGWWCRHETKRRALSVFEYRFSHCIFAHRHVYT